MKKHFKILTVAAMACLLAGVLFYSGCKKAQLEQTGSDYEQLIAAKDYSNNELVRLIKLTDPPLSDHELMGIMIAASPLDDNIIKELLKRGQPPCRCALSDETLQMILLFNLPLSAHILKELEKEGIALSRNLLDNIDLADLPDMELEKANQLMESLLNLKFGDGMSDFQLVKMIRDTVEVFGTLQSDRYFVLAQEFIQALSDLDLRCGSAAGSVTIPCISKHIRAVDLDVVTSIDPITGSKVFKVAFTPIVVLAIPVVTGCEFDPDIDHWKWMDGPICLGGICFGPNINTLWCSDAAMEIQKRLNTCDPRSSCNFFNNVTTSQFTGPGPNNPINQQDPQMNDNFYDHLVFISKSWLPNGHGCLKSNLDPYTGQADPNEMRFYLNGARQTAIIGLPPGLSIEAYGLWGDAIGGNLVHLLDVMYGTCADVPIN